MRDFHFAFPAAREYTSECRARNLSRISSKGRAGACRAGPLPGQKAMICPILQRFLGHFSLNLRSRSD